MLEEDGRPEAYAEAILRRQTGHGHRPALNWGTAQQLYKVVAALEYDRKRRARRPAKGGDAA